MIRNRGHRFSEKIMREQIELQRENLRKGQCCRRRRPVGRRREGQDRRLVVGAGRHRRALPGRPQCRPHPRHQWRDLQARAVALRRAAALETCRDRQRGGGRSGGLPRRGGQTKSPGRRRQPGQSAGRRKRHPDPAITSRTRCLAGILQRHPRDGHHAARHRPALRGKGRALRPRLKLAESDGKRILAELTALAPKLLPYAETVWRLLDLKRREGKRILFEGAQGALLDVDHGTYPYVTSSNTVAAQAATGTGMGPGTVGYVLGICKAYTTRVGQGPFPTELHDEIGEEIGRRGKEFGVNTGRKRRCGWFDATLVRQTVRTCGINGLALTKLDILDGFDTIKVCTGYMLDGKEIDHLPAGEGAQARGGPVYGTIEGWKEPPATG